MQKTIGKSYTYVERLLCFNITTPRLSCNIKQTHNKYFWTFLLTYLSLLYSFAAYLTRKDYNIFTVDWEPLTRFPCYLSAISNTRLVGQCTAQLYSFIMYMGGQAKKTTCVGHSLGAHICGMVSNHLDAPQHRIVGKIMSLA